MYSDTNNIQTLIKWCTFSDTSKITVTEIQQFINDADAYIDSVLYKLYVTPITNYLDIEVLKPISARLAAIEIAHVLIVQAGGECPVIVQHWEEQVKDKLDKLLSYTIVLPNSTRQVVSRGLYSYTAHGNADNGNIATEPEWELAEEQW